MASYFGLDVPIQALRNALGAQQAVGELLLALWVGNGAGDLQFLSNFSVQIVSLGRSPMKKVAFVPACAQPSCTVECLKKGGSWQTGSGRN